MITNQNKKELIALAQSLQENIKNESAEYENTAGVYNGPAMTDAIWVKNGSKLSFFFVSPCIRCARAETFISNNGEYEFSFHAIERYGERNRDKHHVDVVNAKTDKWNRMAQTIADLVMNEKILGVVGCTRNRGKVIRTTNGVLLCSDRCNHDGVTFVNTYVPYDELKGTQKEAVDKFDKGHPELSKRIYSEYFIVYGSNTRYNVMTNKGGSGTIRVKKKCYSNNYR